MKGLYCVLVCALLPALAGCYHYVPATPAALRQGTPVRARLNAMADFQLPQVTVNNIDQVEGELIRSDADELFLSATWLQAVTGNGYAGNGWTVTIPQSNMSGFEEKRFSVWRTGAVIGGLLAASWFGFDALGLTPGRGGGGGGPGNEN
jgi:hypothetical protein